MRASLLPCLLVWWLTPPVALSQSADARPAERDTDDATGAAGDYDGALSDALSAHSRGDYARARTSMERAHQIEPSARTLRGLGIVAFAQERHVEAIRFLEAALASQQKALSPELRASVEELLGHAWAQVARYELLLTPEDGAFLIDGKALDLYAPHTVVLAPGTYALTAVAPAHAPYALTLIAKPGEQRTLHVVLAVRAPAASAPPATRARADSHLDTEGLPPRFWTPKVRWITLGTSTALVATGAALWGLAYVRLQRIADNCHDQPDGACTDAAARGAYREQNVQGLGISAGVLLGVGAAGLLGAGAVELWRLRRRPRSELHAGVRLGIGSLVLRARF